LCFLEFSELEKAKSKGGDPKVCDSNVEDYVVSRFAGICRREGCKIQSE
jgi:hypothetical protein